MGHMLVYTIGDVVTRFRSRNGMRVLHPQGFDSFGLPAENAAIKEGGHPRETVERNIVHITRSMRRTGWAYDWRRALSTHDPEYYRWQQWQFLKFYERGLAYRKEAPVNWCPNDQTVLANEQVARRALRALRRRGRVPRDGAVVLPDHRLRAGAARRSRDGRLARVDQGAPAKLDRPLGRRRDPVPDRGAQRGCPRIHDPPGHALRSDVLRARARARARCTDRIGRGPRVRPAHGFEEDPGARGGGGEDWRLHRASCREPGKRGAAPGIRRGLRADGLRDGRDHGRARARPARLRLRHRIRVAGTTGRPACRRRGGSGDGACQAHRGRDACELRGVRRPARARGRSQDRREARGGRPWPADGQLPPARLGVLATALLGLPDPRRLLRRVRDRSGAGRGAPGDPARDRGLQAERAAAARAGRGMGQRSVSALRPARAPRDRDYGHVRRLLLVLPSLLRRRATTRRRLRARPSTTGTRSTCTSAASTTRRCT